MYSILVINPGSTSTKIAVYDNEYQVYFHNIHHTMEELEGFNHVTEQLEFRKNLILELLASDQITLTNIQIIVGRGGLLRPIESGIYRVNKQMIDDLKNPTTPEHASNLGALIAWEIASTIPGCIAVIVDPVVVDEMQDVARISGLPIIPRRSTVHALNQKAVSRKYALSIHKPYEQLNLVVAHLGGGISISAHQFGKIIDTNQALGGTGAFSPERSGTLDASDLVQLCFNGKYTYDEIKKMLVGKGGITAHLGTNDMRKVSERANSGDQYARLVFDAMAYTIAKEIGAMLAVLKGKADAVLLTGGIANDNYLVSYIENMISPMAPIVVYPGEEEMEALASSGLRVLKGEPVKEY